MQPGFLLKFPGIAMACGGVALVWIGAQRARFRSSGAGPGTVEVDEGRIIYYGPLTGGSVDLRDVSAVTYDPSLHPAHWRLQQPGQGGLLIPVNAAGAERLFDAFATLPGFRMDRALRARKEQDAHSIVIWQRDLSLSAQGTLH